MSKTYTACETGTFMQVAGGTGLAFIAFTEAIDLFIFPPFWSVLFFLMLLALGVGTEFGTLLGVLTCLEDVIEWRFQHHIAKWYTSKWFLAGMMLSCLDKYDELPHYLHML